MPPARFLQWKATLTAAASGNTSPDARFGRRGLPAPEYCAEDRSDRSDALQLSIPGARQRRLTLSSAATLTLPAIGRQTACNPRGRGVEHLSGDDVSEGRAGRALDGFRREWRCASLYRRDSRSKRRTGSCCATKCTRSTISFDSTAFADGDYRIRITASDAPSNTPEDALTTQEESDPFTIDNTPPAISNLQAAGNVVKWHAADALSTIYKAEYSARWRRLDGSRSGGRTLGFGGARLRADLEEPRTRRAHVAVRVSDGNDNIAVAKTLLTASQP